MNKIKTIGKGVITLCSFLGAIGQVVNLVEYGTDLVRKYRKPKKVAGFSSTTNPTSTVEE